MEASSALDLSLQWLPDHEALFPRLASLLTVGGCLAVQMPDTVQVPMRALMRMVAAGGSWTAKFTFPFQRCSSSPDEASEPRW
jgi:trans-aconitate methyltransferase